MEQKKGEGGGKIIKGGGKLGQGALKRGTGTPLQTMLFHPILVYQAVFEVVVRKKSYGKKYGHGYMVISLAPSLTNCLFEVTQCRNNNMGWSVGKIYFVVEGWKTEII